MPSSLQQFLAKQLADAKTDRADIAAKWDWNDLTMDGHGLPWKDDPGRTRPDGSPTWNSRLRYPLCRQRTDSACDIAADALYPKNEVPVEVETDDPDGNGPQRSASVLKTTRTLSRWLKRTDSVGELQRAFRHAARYGDAYTQVFWTRDARGREAYGIECVPNREAFQDWNAEQPADGAYFFRVRSVRPQQARELIGGIEWVDRDLLDAAIRKASNPATSENATAKDLLPSQPRKVEVAQAWSKVPASALAAWLADTAPDGATAQPATADDDAQEHVPVMAYMVGDELVGVLTDPGPCNVRRFVWREGVSRVHGDGMPDLLWEIQDSATGTLRALDNGAKLASGALLGVDDSVAVGFTDVRSAVSQGEVVRLRAGEDISKLVQMLQVKVDLNPMLAVLGRLIELGDDASPVQRVQSGQSAPASTAYELQQRLENAGKFLLGVVRNFARCVNPHIDELFWLAAEQHPDEAAELADATASASFEASYLRKIEAQKALLTILEACANSSLLARRVNWDRFAEMLVGSTSVSADDLLLPADDPSVAAQSESDAMRAQAERALLEAELAKARATANELASRLELNAAKADRERATVRVLDAGIVTDQARTASEVRRTVAQERAAAQPAARAVPRRISVPSPGRAAQVPGGDI